jgi:hypothetical protein
MGRKIREMRYREVRDQNFDPSVAILKLRPYWIYGENPQFGCFQVMFEFCDPDTEALYGFLRLGCRPAIIPEFFQKQIEDAGVRRFREEGQGYVYTWTGRRLPCDEDRAYTLVNYLIQGGAAEVFKSNLIKLDQADLTELLIVPVHDEIVLNAPRKDAQEIMKVVQECMTTREGWAVPLTSGIDGPMENWGEKYR